MTCGGSGEPGVTGVTDQGDVPIRGGEGGEYISGIRSEAGGALRAALYGGLRRQLIATNFKSCLLMNVRELDDVHQSCLNYCAIKATV